MGPIDRWLSAEPQASGELSREEEALLSLLVHVAYCDQELDEREFSFVQRFLPGRDLDALRTWVAQEGAVPLDMSAVAAALPTVDKRWKALRFAVRMAWKDGAVSAPERALLARVVDGLELPKTALDLELSRLLSRGGLPADPTSILTDVQGLEWDAVTLESGAPTGELGRHAFPGSTALVRVVLDGVEIMGLYAEGLVAWFREGPHWVRWEDIVTYTAVPTLAAAIQLHLEDGSSRTLADFRLSGLGRVLDRLYGGERPEPVEVRGEQLRGETEE